MRRYETRSPLFWVGRCSRNCFLLLLILLVTSVHPFGRTGRRCSLTELLYTMTPSPWTPSDGLFRRTITAPHNPRTIRLVKFRPKDSLDIPIFLEEYMRSRQGTEQNYRCSKAIEEKYRDKVTPVKYDNPLNDYISHVPFFRRSEVFPLFVGDGSGLSPAASKKIQNWLLEMKYLDKWDGIVSEVANSQKWIPTTLLQ